MFSRIREIFTKRKELIHLAYHDSLTGLYNRNWLYKNMNTIKGKYVYFIDINNLHDINKGGHIVGDEHIVKCVQSIKLNKGDYLIRYAGDEFILISNNSDVVITNELFSVGMCETIFLSEAIKIADKKMLESKSELKR